MKNLFTPSSIVTKPNVSETSAIDEAQILVRRCAEPRPVGDKVKAAIVRASRRLGLLHAILANRGLNRSLEAGFLVRAVVAKIGFWICRRPLRREDLFKAGQPVVIARDSGAIGGASKLQRGQRAQPR